MDYKVIQDDKRRFGWANNKWPSETSAFPWSPVTGLASDTSVAMAVNAAVDASDAGELPTSINSTIDGVTGFDPNEQLA